MSTSHVLRPMIEPCFWTKPLAILVENHKHIANQGHPGYIFVTSQLARVVFSGKSMERQGHQHPLEFGLTGLDRVSGQATSGPLLVAEGPSAHLVDRTGET